MVNIGWLELHHKPMLSNGATIPQPLPTTAASSQTPRATRCKASPRIAAKSLPTGSILRSSFKYSNRPTCAARTLLFSLHLPSLASMKTSKFLLLTLAFLIGLITVGCGSPQTVDPSKPETMLNPKMSAHQKEVRLAHKQS